MRYWLPFGFLLLAPIQPVWAQAGPVFFDAGPNATN